MKIIDIFEETKMALSSNKARSGLTVLGIVIGISSVIIMLSIGQGAQSSIESNIESIGANLITVSPSMQRGVGMMVSSGRGSAKSLKMSDAEAIAAQINNVLAVAPEISGRYQVTSKGNNTNTQVIGTTPSYTTIKSLTIISGDFITNQHNENSSRVAVLGPTTRDDVFGEDFDAVGQTIKINKIEFKVIGVTEAKGGSGMGSQDDRIYIPINTARRYLSSSEYLSSINVSATDANLISIVEEDINALLLNLHNISDSESADFSTMTQADIASTATSVAKTFTYLLGAVASISLLVGGIGIMNMMLTTVTERTREIGLRKAIGACRKDISIEFLIEAAAITLIGGLLGIIIGWLVATIIDYFGWITTDIKLYSIFLAFGVSAIIGIVFGYYPAVRASKLNPIEALRYE